MFAPDITPIWTVIKTLFFGVFLLGGYGMYSTYKNYKGSKKIESKTRIEPDYRLEANGKKVDTVFIYRIK